MPHGGSEKPWARSTRSRRLPPNWGSEIRPRILQRDPICRWKEHGEFVCSAPSAEVDHKYRGDNHQDWNLQGLCKHHHQLKTQEEAAEALAKKREKISKKFVRTETHASAW